MIFSQYFQKIVPHKRLVVCTRTVTHNSKHSRDNESNSGIGSADDAHRKSKLSPSEDLSTYYYTDMLPWDEKGRPVAHKFLHQVTDLLVHQIDKTNDRHEKVLNFQHPHELLKKLDFELPNEARSLDLVIQDCIKTLQYEVKTGHPHFFNQLSQGLDTISMAGEWLTATANTNMFTYEIAPVFILMEDFVLKKMRKLIGWSEGDSILAPGGTISNLTAVLCARHNLFPAYKENGLYGIAGPLVMFASELAHYSIKSAAMVSGIGISNFIAVPADEKGRMIPSELERLVKEALSNGAKPFFVCSTAGTTVFGAFDPIIEIADICQKYSMWFHVDAAWGGSLLLSKSYRQPRLTGIERADSVTWNPHKLMSTLLQCSTLHVKEKGVLYSCNEMHAEYLFPKDKFYDTQYDTGDKVIQCGRHNDIFKLWLQWRAKGTRGMEAHVDHEMAMSSYFVERLKEMPDKFQLILEEPEYVNVCFWYIPRRLRSMPAGPEKAKILGDIAHQMKQKMMEEGTLMVGIQGQKNLPTFFRNVMSNPAIKQKDVDFLIHELDRIGESL